MPIDPALASLLADPRNQVRPPPPQVPLAKVRLAANSAMLGNAGPEMHAVMDLAGAVDGSRPALRLYRPVAMRAGETSLPIILFAHGGGWVWGNLATHDPICRHLAEQCRANVLAVDYRLSPEHGFRDQVADLVASLDWVIEHAAETGIDANRIAMAGDSAGAELALMACLQAVGRNIAIRHLALIYPALDPGCDSASQHEFATGYMLSRAAMQWFWQLHLGEDAAAYMPALEIPPPMLAVLPPVTLAVAEFDILRDEGLAFAAKLRAAGATIRTIEWAGKIHGFLSLPIAADVAPLALRQISARLVADLSSTREGERR